MNQHAVRVVLVACLLGTSIACDTVDTPSETGGVLDAPRDDAPRIDGAITPDVPTPETDAPSDDAGSPAEGCAGRTALFCEDFEALPEGEAISARWTNETRNGSLTIDGERARGEHALHVHTDDNGTAFLRIPFMPPDNSHFGRMWLYVNAFPSAPDWAHYTLVEGRGTGAGAIRPVGGQFAPAGGSRTAGAYWGIGSDGGPTGDWTNWRTSAPSEGGVWTCVEWELDASDNFIRLTFDGVANDDLTVDTTDHGGNPVDFVFPTFETLRIGWQLYQGGTTPAVFDLWIDDLVLDTERVGCE
jgi:hypothetical protein